MKDGFLHFKVPGGHLFEISMHYGIIIEIIPRWGYNGKIESILYRSQDKARHEPA
jgi:hypothetical protein